MKVLFCAANSWFSPSHVGSHNLATAFADLGHQVAFVSDPISPLHLTGGLSDELKDRFRLWRSGGQWVYAPECGGKIWAYVPAAMLTPHNKPMLRGEFVAANWHKYTLPLLRSIIRKAGFDNFDLVYVDSSAQAYWWRSLAHKKSIFRLADNPAGFAKHTEAAEKAFMSLARQADLTLYTAPGLEKIAKRYNPDAVYFPNAVNYELFSETAPCPPEYKHEHRPIVLYVGAIDRWFDWGCLCRAAKKLPELAFYVIGPKAKIPAEAMGLDNFHFLGPRPYLQLPAYMQYARIGIIPFAVKSFPELVHSINPLKLYEYMAAGLPVVSTRWETLEDLASSALLADSEDEFIQLLGRVAEQDAERPPLKDSQSFAMKFSWRKQAELLLQILNLDGPEKPSSVRDAETPAMPGHR